jgi:tetratricopeptide (TPR) repeat protein
MKRFIACMTLTVLCFISCSKSGKKALDKGQFFEAVKQSTDRLRRDPNNEEAKVVLRTAYRRASDDYLKNIERAKISNQQFRYERVLESYQKLNAMYDMIESCNGCRSQVTPGSYFSEESEARSIAARERISAAELQLAKNNITASRDAHQHLMTVKDFAPDYEGLDVKIEDALFAASLHVVVEQPILHSRLFQYSNEYFQDRINEYLNTNKRLNKYIRFYHPEEAAQIKLKPDHVVRLEFVDFVVGQTLIKSDTKEVVSKDSVLIGSTKVEGNEIKIYDKVKAKYTTTKKSVRSHGVLMMEITDFQNKKLLQRTEMPGEFIWVNEWASFNGDERALTKDQLAVTKGREELPPPPQQLFVEFCKPIYSQFTSRIKAFYDKY